MAALAGDDLAGAAHLLSLFAASGAAGVGGAAAVVGGGAGAVGTAQEWPRLRCLDSSHDAACVRCAPAPPLGEEGAYELVGDPGRKNGEKLLKSLLSRTPEWRSPDERAAAARACDASGHASLARVMRGLDTSAALRKRDMLYLARLWAYRSFLWRPRVSRRRGESKAAAAAAFGPSAAPLHALPLPPHAPLPLLTAPLPPPVAPGAPLPPTAVPDLPSLLKLILGAAGPGAAALLLPALAQHHAAAAAAHQQHAAQVAYAQLLLRAQAGAAAGGGASDEGHAAAPEACAGADVAALLAALPAAGVPPPVQPDLAAALASLGSAAAAV